MHNSLLALVQSNLVSTPSQSNLVGTPNDTVDNSSLPETKQTEQSDLGVDHGVLNNDLAALSQSNLVGALNDAVDNSYLPETEQGDLEGDHDVLNNDFYAGLQSNLVGTLNNTVDNSYLPKNEQTERGDLDIDHDAFDKEFDHALLTIDQFNLDGMLDSDSLSDLEALGGSSLSDDTFTVPAINSSLQTFTMPNSIAYGVALTPSSLDATKSHAQGGLTDTQLIVEISKLAVLSIVIAGYDGLTNICYSLLNDYHHRTRSTSSGFNFVGYTEWRTVDGRVQ